MQLNVSIYDAIEPLGKRIELREAQRKEMKAANSGYRKQHRDELKGMTAYERDRADPYLGFALSNLGGCIRRQGSPRPLGAKQ